MGMSEAVSALVPIFSAEAGVPPEFGSRSALLCFVDTSISLLGGSPVLIDSLSGSVFGLPFPADPFMITRPRDKFRQAGYIV